MFDSSLEIKESLGKKQTIKIRKFNKAILKLSKETFASWLFTNYNSLAAVELSRKSSA